MSQPLVPIDSTEWEVPPKRSIPAWKVLAMIALVGGSWSIAACIGSAIAFQGLMAQTPKFMNSMIGSYMGQVIDEYMIRMYYHDAPSAYTVFSADGQQLTSEEDLEDLLANQYVLFDGYKKVQVTSTEGLPEDFGTSGDPYSEQLQGRIVTLKGTIEYENDVEGTFVAEIEYESQGYRLRSIEITVPQEKIDSYHD